MPDENQSNGDSGSSERDQHRSWEQALSDLLHRFRLDTIRRKIITLSVLATVIPSLTMGWHSYSHSKQTQANITASELRNATTHATQALNLWLRERRHETDVFSNSHEVTDNLEKYLRGEARPQAARRLKTYLTAVRKGFVDYEELAVVSRELRVIGTSAKKPSPIHLPENWLALAKTDAPIIGRPYWDHARTTGVITMGVPLRGSDGRILGALAAKINLLTVKERLTQSSFARRGHLYVVDKDGSVIISSRTLSTAFMETRLDQASTQTLFAQEGSPAEYDDYQEESVMGLLELVAPLDWGVVAEVSQELVFAQTTRIRNVTLMIVSALVVGIGSVAYLLGLAIVRPLERLAGGAAKVARGDLDVELPVSTRGEAGYLTLVFNDMVARLSDKTRELERLTNTDSLTGLSNRKHMIETLAREASRARRQGYPFSILMLDVDRFKNYNDTYGHPAGDRLLDNVAAILRDSVREMDFVARYGGEEFLILLPQSEMQPALRIAERIRKRVETDGAKGLEVTQAVTVSIGVATFPDHGSTPVHIIQRADEVLYEAKRAGRNCVMRARKKADRQASRA